MPTSKKRGNEQAQVPLGTKGSPEAVAAKQELAMRLFVKLFDPNHGRTALHYAEQAIDAAEVFFEHYHR